MSYRLFLIAAAGIVCFSLAACEPETDVFSLSVGDCFQDNAELTDESSEGVSTLPTVDCAEHHDNEVYHTYDLEGDEFPGVTAIRELAEEGCLARFEDFVGTPYDSSRYYYSHLTPTLQTWNEMDDREVVCFLFLPDGVRSEGSAQGSGV